MNKKMQNSAEARRLHQFLLLSFDADSNTVDWEKLLNSLGGEKANRTLNYIEEIKATFPFTSSPTIEDAERIRLFMNYVFNCGEYGLAPQLPNCVYQLKPAIQFVKSQGFKVLQPITEYKEV